VIEEVPASMRWRLRLLWFMGGCGIVTLLIMALVPKKTAHTGPPITKWIKRPPGEKPEVEPPWVPQKISITKYKQVEDPIRHPIVQLTVSAREEFDTIKSRQSRSLEAAVKEYRRRYKLPPPPLFDKWFDFATENNVQLIDEYDNIHDALQPFWGMKPVTIRNRVQEALGYSGDNALIAMTIRGGKIIRNLGGPDWQMEMTAEMMSNFVQLLPDIDLAFNIHDEPRIAIPHDELAQLLSTAQTKNMPAALRTAAPLNMFSPRRPADLEDGTGFKLYKTTRFNEYAHQATWVPGRVSCPPSSPARDVSDDYIPDDTASYLYSSSGFVYNNTAYTDICLSPSLRRSHGFFDRPNAYKLSHELIPIFSQSKVSSYQDILYPSPWYYYGKTVTDQPMDTHKPQYEIARDMPWKMKDDTLYWRGTTTGGFSRNNGWRNQHRQLFLARAADTSSSTAHILSQQSSSDTSTSPTWSLSEVPRSSISHLTSLAFTGVGQCDPADCDAQRSYFKLAKPVNSQDAWGYKHLLDIDGNAFSGRFYAMLRSASAVFKVALFREWHDSWLVPWVHYVPLTLGGEEMVEAVRWATEESEGRQMVEEMAEESQSWAGKVLRNVDLEAYMFRLMLEYARVVDDRREDIGFAM
jgi:hypothetical protein